MKSVNRASDADYHGESHTINDGNTKRDKRRVNGRTNKEVAIYLEMLNDCTIGGVNDKASGGVREDSIPSDKLTSKDIAMLNVRGHGFARNFNRKIIRRKQGVGRAKLAVANGRRTKRRGNTTGCNLEGDVWNTIDFADLTDSIE